MKKLFAVLVTILLLAVIACSGGSSGSSTPVSHNSWTWVSGDNTGNQSGVYGTKGVADGANKPGTRNCSTIWIDNNGNLWLFGGDGYDSVGNWLFLNDLWKFDGTNWTWVSGDNIGNQSGVYGNKGVADGLNTPGARHGSVSWIDNNGNLWLFGGVGYNSVGDISFFNDLWKFDGTNWIWVSGDNIGSQSGVYGNKGVADAANKPGARSRSVSWIDKSGNLWLFGGGMSVIGSFHDIFYYFFNDVWKFDGTNWTWVSGDNKANQSGVYGTKDVADGVNTPGARHGSVSWIDKNGNLWLFGGQRYDSVGNWLYLNDLWKFDGTNWTWVSGDNIGNQSGVYGTKDVADAANKPGARCGSVSWIDNNGNLWLLGGEGKVSAENFVFLNDLWKFDGINWTWVSGDNIGNQRGVYGSKGVADAANKPGARYGSVSWIDNNGNLWLFGGDGYDSAGNIVSLNDLWKYKP